MRLFNSSLEPAEDRPPHQIDLSMDVPPQRFIMTVKCVSRAVTWSDTPAQEGQAAARNRPLCVIVGKMKSERVAPTRSTQPNWLWLPLSNLRPTVLGLDLWPPGAVGKKILTQKISWSQMRHILKSRSYGFLKNICFVSIICHSETHLHNPTHKIRTLWPAHKHIGCFKKTHDLIFNFFKLINVTYKIIYLVFHLSPWTTKPVLSRWGIFLATAKNTLYGQKSLEH